MPQTWNILSGILAAFSLLLLLLALLIRSLGRSEDPPKLLFKWALTLLLIFGGAKIIPFALRSGMVTTMFVLSIYAALVVGAFAVMWAPSIGAFLASPITSLFDGGFEEVEAKPLYSIAENKRARGLYTEAITEIRKQLEKFPGDFTGSMLLASIEAENLNDLAGAHLTIDRLLARKQPLSPGEFAAALHALADWNLQFAQDQDAARLALEKILDTYPNTPLSQIAAQRIAHLANPQPAREGERTTYHVTTRERDLGLKPGYKMAGVAAEDPQAQAAQYVKQLEEHPLDTETREKLALLYAEAFQRVDLAVDQLEQLIALPNESQRRIVHWLNLMATVHTRFGNDWVSAEQCLRRIMDRFPDSSAATVAQTRLAFLKLEVKGHEKSQVKQLGSFEKDLGLKRFKA